jgi:hypothetical protein
MEFIIAFSVWEVGRRKTEVGSGKWEVKIKTLVLLEKPITQLNE